MNTPTATEFLSKQDGYLDLAADYPRLDESIQDAMIEFAKIHVKAALKEANKKAKVETIEGTKEVFVGWGAGRTPTYGKELITKVKENSILNAYPLTNIK